MIHYNHIEILLKEICDVGPLFTWNDVIYFWQRFKKNLNIIE
jgi:hypothetical protein